MRIHTWMISVAIAVYSLAFAASAHPSSGIVVDRKGNVYFSDLSRGLLKIDTQGKVTTISKEGGHWLALDTNGAFSKIEFEKSAHWPRWFKRRTLAGMRPALITDGGSPLVVAPDRNLYCICNDERMIPGGRQLARLTPGGKETLVSPGLGRVAEEMGGIKGLAAGPDGSLFLKVLEHINANSEAHEDWPPRVRKVARDGTAKTLVTFVPGQSKPEQK